MNRGSNPWPGSAVPAAAFGRSPAVPERQVRDSRACPDARVAPPRSAPGRSRSGNGRRGRCDGDRHERRGAAYAARGGQLAPDPADGAGRGTVPLAFRAALHARRHGAGREVGGRGCGCVSDRRRRSAEHHLRGQRCVRRRARHLRHGVTTSTARAARTTHNFSIRHRRLGRADRPGVAAALPRTRAGPGRTSRSTTTSTPARPLPVRLGLRREVRRQRRNRGRLPEGRLRRAVGRHDERQDRRPSLRTRRHRQRGRRSSGGQRELALQRAGHAQADGPVRLVGDARHHG